MDIVQNNSWSVMYISPLSENIYRKSNIQASIPLSRDDKATVFLTAHRLQMLAQTQPWTSEPPT